MSTKLTIISLFLSPFIAYSQCASNATSTADEDILNVTFGTLNNSSTCATTGGAGSILNEYSNYTAVAAPNITQCANVSFSVQIGTCGGNYGNAIAIFIDWNGDLDFVDAGETVYTSASSTTGPHTESGSITVPSNASTGLKRMRVVNVETGTPSSITACGTYSWGETEDYSVNVVAGAALAYSSSNVTQIITGNVTKCTSNQQIIGIQVVMGAGCSAALTQFQLGAGSSTNLLADVSKIHIYYTGTSSTYAATNEYVVGGTTPTGSSNTINGNQGLTGGTNYFWITYDISSGATVSDLIDGSCAQMTIAGVTRIPTTTNPAGNGTITMCTAPGGVTSGLETWLRADIGVTGATPVTAWNNQYAAGTGVLVNGSPNINTISTSYNYNPYIDFTAPAGSLADGVAANRQCLRLSGFSGVNGINYTSLFFAFNLTDLTRTYTHIATVDNVTNSTPANGTLHGDINGASASILWETYDITDFGTSSPAGTWQRNGTNVLSNSIHFSTKHILSANCTTGGNTTLNTFLGGQRDLSDLSFLGHTRDWKGPAAEIIGYTASLSALNRQKIDSYLGVKYGITYPSNYLSTSGSTIFTTAAPYNNNIIGIGRDDSEALTQKQSHNDDDLVRIYLSSLAATNAANAGTFSSDISYVMTGATTGSMCATAAANAEMPTGLASCTLYSRIEREWKVTRTNMAQNFNMDFQLATCGAPSSVNTAHLRLLVDDDGNFANGGTQCYYNGDGTGIVFSYSNPTITVSNINIANHIPNNATKYITIASINVLTPLPVELLEFNAQLNDERKVDLTWSTETELNNDHFVVEKSQNLVDWSFVAKINGAGNSQKTLYYQAQDNSPYLGLSYYRLKQVDTDGAISYSEIRTISVESGSEMIVFPNPAQDFFTITGKNISPEHFILIDPLGKTIALDIVSTSKDALTYSTNSLSSGIYFINYNNGAEEKTLKLTIQ